MPRMPRRHVKSLLAFLVAASVYSTVSAADRTVTVGRTQIDIPVAEGHVDTTDTPAGAQLGNASIDKGSVLLAMQPRSNGANTFFVVKTLKDTMAATFTVGQFQYFARHMHESQSNLAKSVEIGNRQALENQQQLADATQKTIGNVRFGEPVLIGPGREDAVSSGYTAAFRVNGEIQGKNQSLVTLMCTHVVLAQGKLIFIQMHSPWETQDDPERVRAECRRYVDRFIAANPQR